MKIYEDISGPVDLEPTVITIGKFDGAHLGHLEIFRKMMQIAKEKGLRTLAITFSTPPPAADTANTVQRIFTREEKRENLRKTGLDYLVELPFDRELQHISGEDFLRDILIGRLKMKVMVCGADCAFGYKKSGNTALLEKLKDELDYDYVIVEKIKDENRQEISSSMIRDLLQDGRIEAVNRLIGSAFSIRGIVESGNRLGQTIGFPTVNLFPDPDKLLPKIGVYAGKTKILRTGEVFESLTNIGTNPSIRNDSRKHVLRVESYLYHFDRDIYNEEIEVSLLKYIRGEMHFSGLDELKEQLSRDRETVAKFHMESRVK